MEIEVASEFVGYIVYGFTTAMIVSISGAVVRGILGFFSFTVRD